VDETQIDWGSASVDDGQLTVALTGKPSSEWRERVQSVLERLRHLLESAVLQANADLADDDAGGDGGAGDERSDADQRMTDAFRAFADG
jgi:hypothetical protein